MRIVKLSGETGRSRLSLCLLSFSIAMFPTLSHANANDVKCDLAADKLVAHFAKDFKKAFNKDSKAKEMKPFFVKMCEAGKVDANKKFKAGKYNITSAAMGVDYISSMKMSGVNENYKPMISQYASVSYMYGYVNWFVN